VLIAITTNTLFPVMAVCSLFADYLMVERVSRQPYGNFSGGLQ